MKAKIVSLFLKREHLILLSKMLQITENTTDQDIQIQKIDSQNQKSENRILKTERWPQQDLDYFQNCFLQIANLTFSYFKFHFPANSALQIKEHIKFVHVVKQINFGGVTIEEVFKQQRTRLNLEVSKITKSIKLIDEPIMPKLMNSKIDLVYIQRIQEKYFFPKNNDFMAPYLILSLKPHIHKTTARHQNNQLSQSITSLEDIPPFQFMNANLIQPILNYESLKNSFEYKFNKLMQRNSLVQYTIKRYSNKIKQFEIKSEDDHTDTSLSEIKKLFCVQIKQLCDNKLSQSQIDTNLRLFNSQSLVEFSPKITPFQSIRVIESQIFNQIKEEQEFQEIHSTFNQEQCDSKREDFRQTPNVRSLNISQQYLQDSAIKSVETQKNLQFNSNESFNKLESRLIKQSLKSLDFQSSELLNQSTGRNYRKIKTQKLQDQSQKSQSNHRLQNIPHQTIEPPTSQFDVQNMDIQTSILSNRNLQQKSLDRITLKPLDYQSARLQEIKDPNLKESSFPYIKNQLPNIGLITCDSHQQRLKESESKFSLQSNLQKKIQSDSLKDMLLLQKKNCNLKDQLQNKLILLTHSEQILTTLMSNGSIRGTQLYQQLLQPITINSNAKFLTPKSNNIISRTKFRRMQQESKMFSLK
ncbi:unnamed protein product [Paramecium octaurelia]|uniref:Uncharacterized protein n=1 Tax=Paramecium octaurelia TaxID=43137 RepID=A0A8S1YFW4_PAROT|nr:unnamed protein product [Paramecium octaurelia]